MCQWPHAAEVADADDVEGVGDVANAVDGGIVADSDDAADVANVGQVADVDVAADVTDVADVVERSNSSSR